METSWPATATGILAAAIFLALSQSIACRPAQAEETISSLLQRQSQEFSDASSSGNAAAMEALLDRNVILVNENGQVSSKDDLISGAAPPPPGVHVALHIIDWQCAVHGNVAIGSFVDDQTGSFHGQAIHAQFRSVETWLEEGKDWRLIGSQTLAMQTDPAAVQLPSQTLRDYVGTYQAAPDFEVVFTLDHGQLMASVNGGPQTRQLAELRDVMFTPGNDRVRRIFERDPTGQITGFISRHEGHDIRFKKTAT